MASYTTQKVIVRRESERYEAGGQGHGYSRVIAAGRTLTINPRSIGFWQWQAGDYMCGTSGGTMASFLASFGALFFSSTTPHTRRVRCSTWCPC